MGKDDSAPLVLNFGENDSLKIKSIEIKNNGNLAKGKLEFFYNSNPMETPPSTNPLCKSTESPKVQLNPLFSSIEIDGNNPTINIGNIMATLDYNFVCPLDYNEERVYITRSGDNKQTIVNPFRNDVFRWDKNLQTKSPNFDYDYPTNSFFAANKIADADNYLSRRIRIIDNTQKREIFKDVKLYLLTFDSCRAYVIAHAKSNYCIPNQDDSTEKYYPRQANLLAHPDWNIIEKGNRSNGTGDVKIFYYIPPENRPTPIPTPANQDALVDLVISGKVSSGSKGGLNEDDTSKYIHREDIHGTKDNYTSVEAIFMNTTPKFCQRNDIESSDSPAHEICKSATLQNYWNAFYKKEEKIPVYAFSTDASSCSNSILKNSTSASKNSYYTIAKTNFGKRPSQATVVDECFTDRNSNENKFEIIFVNEDESNDSQSCDDSNQDDINNYNYLDEINKNKLELPKKYIPNPENASNNIIQSKDNEYLPNNINDIFNYRLDQPKTILENNISFFEPKHQFNNDFCQNRILDSYTNLNNENENSWGNNHSTFKPEQEHQVNNNYCQNIISDLNNKNENSWESNFSPLVPSNDQMNLNNNNRLDLPQNYIPQLNQTDEIEKNNWLNQNNWIDQNNSTNNNFCPESSIKAIFPWEM